MMNIIIRLDALREVKKIIRFILCDIQDDHRCMIM